MTNPSEQQATTVRLPDVWQEALEALRALPTGSVAMLVGPADAGKTTFAALAAQALAQEGRRVLLVDGDIGQGEVGPPGVVGVALASAETPRIPSWKTVARFFVGAISPASAFSEHIIAVGQATLWAHRRTQTPPDLVVVDTTGLIHGGLGRRLKIAKARIVAPDLILAFGVTDNEALHPLLDALGSVSPANVLRLPTPSVIRTKPAALRRTRRRTRLSAALEHSQTQRIPLADVATTGATLGAGTFLTPLAIQELADALNLPSVLYAEHDNDGALALFLQETPTPRQQEAAKRGAASVGASNVRLISLRAYENVYVGLCEAGGRCLSVGRFVGWDSERRALVVDAPPLKSTADVEVVMFGRFRVSADGTPLEAVRPDEL